MPPSSADANTKQSIRRLAAAGTAIFTAKQAYSDMLAHHLAMGDVCDAIVEWIDAGERVKPTTLHSFKGRVGQPAYEMKPRINPALHHSSGP